MICSSWGFLGDWRSENPQVRKPFQASLSMRASKSRSGRARLECAAPRAELCAMVKAANRKAKKSKGKKSPKSKGKKASAGKAVSPKRQKKVVRRKGLAPISGVEPAAFTATVDCPLPNPGTPLQRRIIAFVLAGLEKFSNEVSQKKPYPAPANNVHNLDYVVDSFRREFADVIDMDRFSLDGKEIINETQNKNVSCIVKLFLNRSKKAILTEAKV
jgi:hypothetical protein